MIEIILIRIFAVKQPDPKRIPDRRTCWGQTSQLSDTRIHRGDLQGGGSRKGNVGQPPLFRSSLPSSVLIFVFETEMNCSRLFTCWWQHIGFFPHPLFCLSLKERPQRTMPLPVIFLIAFSSPFPFQHLSAINSYMCHNNSTVPFYEPAVSWQRIRNVQILVVIIWTFVETVLSFPYTYIHSHSENVQTTPLLLTHLEEFKLSWR